MTTVRETLNDLLIVDSDWASELNGIGFNRGDTAFAHWIASFPKWTKEYQDEVHEMLKKYWRQYDDKWDELEFEEVYDIPDSIFGMKERGNNILSLDKSNNGRVVGFKMQTVYSFKDIASSIPGKTWDTTNKIWLYPIAESTLKSLHELINNDDLYRFHVFIVDDETREYIEKNKDIVKNTIPQENDKKKYMRANKLKLHDRDGQTYLQWFTQYAFKDIAKSVGRSPDVKWNGADGCWEYTTTNTNVLEKINALLNDPDVRNNHIIEVTDECKQFIEQVQEQADQLQREIERIAEIKNKYNIPDDIKLPITVTPFEHQKIGFGIGMSSNATSLLMEMGCGKTLTEVAIVGQRYLNNEIDRCIIIAPLSVLGVWKKEFENMSTIQTNIGIVRGTPKQKASVLDLDNLSSDKLNIIIVSYDSISPRKKKNIIDGKEVITYHGGVYDNLMNWIGDHGDTTIMVLDESQRIKNFKSNRADSIHKLGEICKYKNILTGTPVTQNPLDVFSQYKFLNRDIYGDNYYRFRNKYAMMGGYKGKEIIGYKNIDELKEKAHSIGYRVTKNDALDLPEITDVNVYCELKESKKIYNKVRDEIINEIFSKTDEDKNKMFIAITKLLRLSQITGGFLPNNYSLNGNDVVDIDHTKKTSEATLIGREKLNVLKEIIEDFPVDKKLVIFCRFIPEIKEIKNMITDLGRTVKTLTGSVKSSDRDGIINSFQNDVDPNVLIIQIQTGGLGITLTKADTAIFYSYDYSFANYEQAKARIHRIGQDNKCTYIHIIAEDTIDVNVMASLKTKKSIADYIVDLDDDIDQGVYDFLFKYDDEDDENNNGGGDDDE